MAISRWPTLVAGRMYWPKLIADAAVSLATLLAILLVCLEIFASPFPALLAIAIGVCVRALGQRQKLKQAPHSKRLGDLADFRFNGHVIECEFDDSAVHHSISDWRWILAASCTAGLVCLLTQHIDSVRVSLLAGHASIPSWLSLFIEKCRPGLPLYIAALFFRIRGPERRWSKQLKSLIELRCTTAMEQTLARREMDGLGDGIDLLWQRLGVGRGGAYRAALLTYMRTYTKEVVLEPTGVTVLLSTLTELARLDLKSLSAAVDQFDGLEREIAVVQALALASRNPLHEMRAETLKRKSGDLPPLAANRLWHDFTARAVSLQTELNDLRERLGRLSASIPTITLPAGSDPYRILGVTVDTPTPVLRKLRTRLAQLYHPDVPGSTGNSAKMSEVNAAYDAVMRDREQQGE